MDDAIPCGLIRVSLVWPRASAAAKWRFSVLDVVGALNGESDYEKTRNYWKYLKAKLKREGNELGSVTTQLRFAAPDGKLRLANVMDADYSYYYEQEN